MSLKLRPIEKNDLKLIVDERNKFMETLRTPFMLNIEMQYDYFEKVLCNRLSNTRYWSIDNIEYLDPEFIGYGGLESIQNESRIAEISILIFKKYQHNGYGSLAVSLFLDQAFNFLNLDTIYGECYFSSSAIQFWEKIIDKYSCYHTKLPRRKYFNGRYYDSLYFSITRSDFNK